MQDNLLSALNDEEFVDEFFADELSEALLEELDRRMEDQAFERYYKDRLDKQYVRSTREVIIAYLPMIIMLLLVSCGIYLLASK